MDGKNYSLNREFHHMVGKAAVGALLAVTAVTAAVPATTAYAAIDASRIKESEAGTEAPTDYIRLDASQTLKNVSAIYGISNSGINYSEPYSGDLTLSDFKTLTSGQSFTIDWWGDSEHYSYYLVFLKPDDGYLFTNLKSSGLGQIYSTDVPYDKDGNAIKSYYGNLGNYPKIVELCTQAKAAGYTAVIGWARWNTDTGICAADFTAEAVKPTLDITAEPTTDDAYKPGETVTFKITVKTNKLDGVPDSDYENGNIVAEEPVVTKVTVGDTVYDSLDLTDNGDGTYTGYVDYVVTKADLVAEEVNLVVDANQSFSCKLGSGSPDIRTEATAVAEGTTEVPLTADQSVSIDGWKYDGTFHGSTLTSDSGYDESYTGTPTYTYAKAVVDANGNTTYEPIEGEPTEPGDYQVTATWNLGDSDKTVSATSDFTITPLSFTVDPVDDVVYNGEGQPAKPVVKDEDGNVLEEGVDYKLVYKDADGNVVEDPTDVGNYTVEVVGLGGYAGTTDTVDYDITPVEIKVQAFEDLVYNGEAQPQEPVVTDPDGNVLEKDKDYVLVYKDADGNEIAPEDIVDVANYTVEVKGIGNYTGEEEVDYDITPLPIDSKDEEGNYTFTVEPLEDLVYNGEAQPQEPVVKDPDGNVLEKDKDYVLVYKDADGNVIDPEDIIDVATYTVEVQGIGNYTGTQTVDYDILPIDISAKDEEGNYIFTVSPLDDLYYNGEAQPQEPVVTDPDGNVLEKDKDYVLIYKDEDGNVIDPEDVVDAGNYTVEVQGIGIYGGTQEVDYDILPLDISAKDEEDNYTFTVAPLDDLYYNGESQAQEPVVTDPEGNVLEKGKDYILVYKDSDGNVVDPKDVVDVDTYTVEAHGIGNYTGVQPDDYDILPLDLAARDAKDNYTFTVEPLDDVVYNGKAQPQEPVVKDPDGNVLEKDKDYVLVYKDADGNVIDPEDVVNVGTYTVEVQGIGNYTGSQEVDYKITPAKFTVEAPLNVVYNGKSQMQKPVVKAADGTILVEGKDYELIYSKDTTNPGTVVVTVKGLGNYAGTSIETSYKITPVSKTVKAGLAKTSDPTAAVEAVGAAGGIGAILAAAGAWLNRKRNNK